MATSEQLMSDIPPDSALHLQVIDRVKNIPTVHSAIEKAGSAYSVVKESHPLINWALTQTEAGVQHVMSTAANLSAPLIKEYEEHISTVDKKLCEGLNVVEQNVPIINEPPAQIYEAAKAVMSTSLHPAFESLNLTKESAAQDASKLLETAVEKANELLSTHYGNKVVQGVDNVNVLVNALLDRYFPVVDVQYCKPGSVSAEANQALHVLQTVMQLSAETTRRVTNSIVAQLKTLSAEDIKNFTSAALSILQLINFLQNARTRNKD